MVKIENFFNNENIEEILKEGDISVLEYLQDLSVSRASAMIEYYSASLGIKKRQVVISLKRGNPFTISAGAMQWTAGEVSMIADVKGIGDLVGKALSSKVTKESAIKPKYEGNGYLVLEPTYKHILIEDVGKWGGIVLEDGLFLACESKVKQKTIARSNLSSVFGGEGLFNLMLSGEGLAVLESPVPRSELIVVQLTSDEIRIDGSYAIAWSSSLEFRVEKSSKSLLGSAVSGEGLVNVYRGTGIVLMAPAEPKFSGGK